MSRVDPKQLLPKEKMKYLDLLWSSIAGLKSREEVKNFFKDLLSETEAVMLARRLLIAQKLLEGRHYEEIEEELGTSKATVANVHRWLISGFGGYEKAVKEFQKVLERREEIEEAKRIDPFSFEGLKRKYPLHFLLFNLFSSKNKDKGRNKNSFLV